jgi:DNA-binding response OmpR family regulator/signal transduction histidine kinase
MTLSLGSEYDKAVGGLWIEENATSVVPSLPESPKVLPIGFTAEYRVLAEVCASMSSGFMLLNRSERVTYSNKNALHLLQLERAERVHIQHFDVRQHLLSLATDPRHVKPDLDQAWQHPEQESATDLSLFDAATQWLRVRSFPVRDNDGQFLGRGILFDDITLEKTAAEARAETLSMAAHELKTPLAIVKGCATTLLGGSARWDPTLQREMLQMIDTQSDRLYDILNTLLDVWRFDAGAQPLHMTQIQFSDLLLQLVQRWQKQAPDHRFILDIADVVPLVTCDVLRVEQALNHLLQNAVTYSPVNSIVRLQLETNDNELRVGIADEGIGIAAEHLNRIFERFYRVPTDRDSENQGGSGLGLSSARATIEAHHGRIWADSLGHGQGSTFYFTLPFAPPSVAPSIAQVYAPAIQEQQRDRLTMPLHQDRRMRVLLAENDARLARYVRSNLEEQQYRVQVVNHGVQFLRQLDLEEPDIILLASQLSDMQGQELLQRLREFSSAPVLMLTDACDEDERVHLFDLGCDDVVVKPFGMKELLARVRSLLRRRPLSPSDKPVQQSVFTTGGLVIDYAQHLVTVNGQTIQLSRTEYKLLSTLAQNVGMVVTHELLLEKVWGPEYNRDVDFIWVYISRLRRKIEANSRRPEYILTVPDVGYKLAKI